MQTNRSRGNYECHVLYYVLMKKACLPVSYVLEILHLLFTPQYPKLRSTICLVGFTSSLVHFSSTLFCSTLPFSSGLTTSTTPPSPESSE